MNITPNIKKGRNQGFTLIELLIVIAIIAIISVVVILTLNPAELLRQSRDSNRISDLSTLKSALALYSTDVSGSSNSTGSSTVCYNSLAVATTTIYAPNQSGVWASTTTCAAWFVTATSMSTSSGRNVNATGWIPVNFSAISYGSPIGALPVDPLNTAGTGASKSSGGFFYSYITNGTTFKLSALMESAKYSTNGSNDVESTDGGNNNYMYEQGTNLAL